MKKLLVTLVIASLLALPLSAMAMEKMSGNDMGGVTGQAGVTIAFGSTSTTTVTFSSVAWGDPDGYGAATGAGWLRIYGDSAISIDQEIAAGEKLELDIATTAAEFNIAAGSSIAANTTFIAVGLPSIQTDITTPDTLNVELGTTSVGGTVGTLGILRLGGLSIDQGTPDKLYIYAH